MYASFLRIRAPCISSFLTSLLETVFINGLITFASSPAPPQVHGVLLRSATIHREAGGAASAGSRAFAWDHYAEFLVGGP